MCRSDARDTPPVAAAPQPSVHTKIESRDVVWGDRNGQMLHAEKPYQSGRMHEGESLYLAGVCPPGCDQCRRAAVDGDAAARSATRGQENWRDCRNQPTHVLSHTQDSAHARRYRSVSTKVRNCRSTRFAERPLRQRTHDACRTSADSPSRVEMLL